MLRLFGRTDGMFHPVVYGLATIIVFVLGKLWPAFELGLWMVFLAAIGLHLYVELRKPVNYASMTISDNIIEYVASGRREVIRLEEIAKVQLVRERSVFDTGIESKWVVHAADGKRVELMDEWPHRKQLMRAFDRGLPGFDVASAKKGLRAWKEGVWLCFESPARDRASAA
jgi:hypothetical protein